MFEEIKNFKTFSEAFDRTLKHVTTFKQFVSVIAGLHFGPFREVAEHYKTYVCFQTKITRNEHAQMFKHLNALIPCEVFQTDSRKLEDYAIVIVQRLARYILFIRELIKGFEKTEELKLFYQEELKLFRIALENAKKGTKMMNEAVYGSSRLHSASPETTLVTALIDKEEKNDPEKPPVFV